MFYRQRAYFLILSRYGGNQRFRLALSRKSFHHVPFLGKPGGGSHEKRLSRTERRLQGRKLRNKEMKEEARASREHQHQLENKAFAPVSKIRARLAGMFRPKVPGINVYLNHQHFISLVYRLPIFLAMCYVITNDDYVPYVIQGSLGPSMLPTIQFIGDLWLVETGAWYRLFGWSPSLEVGDIVLWREPSTQRVSCKRIIGVEGGEIRRYGQYVHLYQDRQDLAILWPKDAKERHLGKDRPWDAKEHLPDKDFPLRTMVVPTGHIWLEGDCPPFSLDSRHYGPIPISWVRGRLVLRLWPFQRENEDEKPIARWISRERPVPFSSLDQYLGKRFNFYRIPKQEQSQEQNQ